jgi:23S rRNA pseudouridine1911/1915/1917 synthase
MVSFSEVSASQNQSKGSLLELIVPQEAETTRLDKWLARAIPERSRAEIQRWIEGGRVRVNDRVVVDAAARIRTGDRIRITIPAPVPASLEPAEVPYFLLFEDDHILVVHKPAGVPTHPGPGHLKDTLLNGLLAAGKTLSPIGLPWRPGVVHRLDKDTSGVLVLAKTEAAHFSLVKALQGRRVHRVYTAYVVGIPRDPVGSICADIGRDPAHRVKFSTRARTGKPAITHYRLIHAYEGVRLSQLELTLETGRTHQIRVHLSAAGFPVLGDPLYGGRRHLRSLPDSVVEIVNLLPGQFLHAGRLSFAHPVTGEILSFSAPLPEPFVRLHDLLCQISRAEKPQDE